MHIQLGVTKTRIIRIIGIIIAYICEIALIMQGGKNRSGDLSFKRNNLFYHVNVPAMIFKVKSSTVASIRHQDGKSKDQEHKW